MKTANSHIYKHSSFSGLIGVAQADITPPVGCYLGNWGAAKSPISAGVHRPLKLTCITFQSSPRQKPLVLIAADLGWWKNKDDERFVRDGILKEYTLEPSQLMFCLSHTHAGPGLCRNDSSKAGGEHIEPYLLTLQQAGINAIADSLSNTIAATLEWHYGKCTLATNRDLETMDQIAYAVGFNPANKADDLLLVGRIIDKEEKVMATIVNYACHPTTLGWDNLLISPDYVGAMREIVQLKTGAPCLFLQGASGELAPAEQYVDDVTIADKHGRQLGYAVLSTLESMLPPGKELLLKGVEESGASLAIWKRSESHSNKHLSAKMIDVKLPLKELPAVSEIEKEWKACNDPVLKERLWRKLHVRRAVGDNDFAAIPLWLWQLGDALLIGQPNEAYSLFQQELRDIFPGKAIAVMNVVNGHIGYLPPARLYEKDLYAAWQTPFAKGSLERLIQTAIGQAKQMIHHR